MTNAQAQSRTLDHEEIAALIPHQGSMCLLDQVVDWNAQKIECSAISHRAIDNPLRRNGRLGAAIGIEYAAQAMAVHGALLAARDSAPKKGMITRVQRIALHAERLDDCPDALRITAERLMGDERMVRYGFELRCAERVLLEGEASVILDA
ncbi:MAG: 3-hydroxylacyl-ACP dehydratase [Halothiobacillus sp. 14-55-98]|jgi:predicted hotdog family 3-hydroxylacyl-ACP dehydratase|nr:MAG: 3-hydroxylacyl-ACP dehydratase [Halothiobacillus sp. 14-55-98]